MPRNDPPTTTGQPVAIDLRATSTTDAYTQPIYRTTYRQRTRDGFYSTNNPSGVLAVGHTPTNTLLGTAGFLKPATIANPNANEAVYVVGKGFLAGTAYRLVVHAELAEVERADWVNNGILGYGSLEPQDGLVELLRYKWRGPDGQIPSTEGSVLAFDCPMVREYIGRGALADQFEWYDTNHTIYVAPSSAQLRIKRMSAGDDTPTTDRAQQGLSTHADFTYGSSLYIAVDNDDYPEAKITEVRFYRSAEAKEEDTPLYAYNTNAPTPGAESIDLNDPDPVVARPIFSIMHLAQQVVCITDLEQNPPAGDNAWYSVAFTYNDNGRTVTKTLDPELTNKTGSKQGGSSWE